MWDDQTSQESAEDGVDADDVRKEGREEHEDEGDGHHHRARHAGLETAGTMREPPVRPSDGEEQEERVAKASEQNPDGSDPA